MNYKPHKKTAKALDRAWRYLEDISYQVSFKWLFYRLLEDGIYKKKDYKSFVNAVSYARKNFYREWRPWTLSDDTRFPIIRHGRFRNITEWETWKEELVPDVDEWYGEKVYLEVWFETKAMVNQFISIVPKPITLEPFAGDISIAEKWRIAKRLEDAHRRYNKPVKILYFGDLKVNHDIPTTALKDIDAWSDVHFDFEKCGITKKQAEKLKLIDSFEKPGEYQWESLNDAQAKEIIRLSIYKYVR